MGDVGITARRLPNGQLEYCCDGIQSTPAFYGWWLKSLYNSSEKVERMIKTRNSVRFNITLRRYEDEVNDPDIFKTDIGSVYEKLCSMSVNKAEKYKKEIHGEVNVLSRLLGLKHMYLYEGDKWYYVGLNDGVKIPAELLYYSYNYQKLLETVDIYRPNLSNSWIK